MRGPVTAIIRSAGIDSRTRGNAEVARREMCSDAGSADGDDANHLVVGVAELGPQRLAFGLADWLEAGHIAGKFEVLFGPCPDRSETGAEVVRHDIVGFADEQCSVPQVRVSLDVVDHLGVVVRSQDASAVPPSGIGSQPTKSVSQQNGARFEFGVLVKEAVELPRLVADPQVVGLLLDDVLEDHEIGDQDLVEPTPGPEAVQFVFRRL